MNRREFVAGTLAGLALTRFPAALADGEEQTLPRARWLQNGLIDAGGTHEPYTFLVRKGGWRDARSYYERQQSEPLIRRLKEQGIEVFHTHLYKGFGMVTEMPEMEDTRRAAEIAHRYGLKVDTYIQWNTMMYETFFIEEPRAKDWIQRDINGQPILLTYSYQQSFRYRPCFSNHAYLDYLKKVVRYAVLTVGTDFIHFDNFDLNPEPDSCHCPLCVQGFRDRLKSKYSPDQRKERLGFESVQFVSPPQWNFQNPPQALEIIVDPVVQEWIDFRCQMMTDALKQMALYAKSLNPEVVIEINPHGITGGNRAWAAGIDHARILKWTEAFWTEEENLPGVTADGRLISKVRSYKLARAYRNTLLTVPDNVVAIAESLAFNQTLGFVGEDPLDPTMLKYVAFYRANRELFTGSEDIASVAVLRSYPSITFHNMLSQLAAILVEQTLLHARVPFDLIFDEHLAGLSKYNVLVLPDAECLSDTQITAIKRFVDQGGGLVVTGASGFYDEWRRRRVEPGLLSLTGEQRKLHGDGMKNGEAGKSLRREVGKGRVAYFSEVQFDGTLPTPEPYFEINNRYWKLPANWEELVEGIRWTNRRSLPVDVSGPPYLVANLVALPAKRRRLLHLINYNAQKSPSIQQIEVTFQSPENRVAKDVVFYSPDLERPLPLQSKGGPDKTSVVVPEVNVYGIVCATW